MPHGCPPAHPWRPTVARISLAIPILLLAVGCAKSEGGDEGADDGRVRKDTGVHPDAEETPSADADTIDSGHDAGVVIMDAALPDASPIVDRDNDSIPDDEDPNPGRANPILFRDTFETVRPEWLFTSVDMRIDPARSLLRVPQIEPLVREGWLGPRPDWGNVYVRGLIRVTALGSSPRAGAGRMGIIARANQVSPDRYLQCGFDIRSGTVFLSEHNGGTEDGRTLVQGATPVAHREWFLLTFKISGEIATCTVQGVTVTSRSSLFFAGSAGFRAFDAAFDADWFEVYDLQ